MTDRSTVDANSVSRDGDSLSAQNTPGPPNQAAKKDEIHTPVGSIPITGFIAGILSGATKLVRLQVSGDRFNNSVMNCLKSTIRKEGFKGLYKGGTPPLFGWALMDSVMLGSLTNYRRLLAPDGKLELWQHTLAGLGAGLTVSLVATPIEHVKARLQVQYDAASRTYSGPISATKSLVRGGNLYNGLLATMIQRSWFSVFWASYALTTESLTGTSLSPGTVSFLAGGSAATVYWAFAFPFDVVKQRIMTDSTVKPKYVGWWNTFRGIGMKDGWRGYYRGFTPCILRSFPTNASAVLVFDTTMRYLGTFGY
ncbi:Mitochondrial ornithine carrier protein [Taphrina deformans PYCC 5710]|uniref:Mitochondrial ornithine carrier protein n=1 Tax=Taphrina deformans (strain PYCC 5710 / ATCC 11124 / CBS 356.35 / IMI 108563 / JCM 9778 / NBRC 8474) TaxID=1097556 RepID=R4X6F8_TAPDE|nr:Mitochondrial ornithine carrier protein [Taphrina deformans PYCC 5710]|eukprot:CCG80655.1 Mitochondrial ornithine carrier protein [Taphrina deformans PYCC 5710]